MKKLITLKLQNWFEYKQTDAFINASANGAYTFTVEKETEKAIMIQIRKDGKETWNKMLKPWTMWIPKSAVLNLAEVMA